MSQSMQTIVQDRKVVVTVPDDIPDGTRVELRFVPVADQFGMDESQWRTDSAAIKEWSEWLDSMEPIEFAKPDEFDRKFAEFNVQAVREQMFRDGQ
jgi:hypothetical protein